MIPILSNESSLNESILSTRIWVKDVKIQIEADDRKLHTKLLGESDNVRNQLSCRSWTESISLRTYIRGTVLCLEHSRKESRHITRTTTSCPGRNHHHHGMTSPFQYFQPSCQLVFRGSPRQRTWRLSFAFRLCYTWQMLPLCVL
jgi:hypothetical protein